MDYAHPEALASIDWVSQHAADPNVRVVEVDVDTKAYDEGHVPGALHWSVLHIGGARSGMQCTRVFNRRHTVSGRPREQRPAHVRARRRRLARPARPAPGARRPR